MYKRQALLALIADPLVPLLMSDRWLPSVPILRILCYSAMIFPISHLLLLSLQAQGYSKMGFRLDLIKLSIGVITVLCVSQYSMTALVWSIVGIRAMSYFVNVWCHVKTLGYTWRFQAFDILPTFGLCAVSAFLASQVGRFNIGNEIFHMVIVTGVFTLSLIIGIFALRLTFFKDIWNHADVAMNWFQRQTCKKF